AHRDRHLRRHPDARPRLRLGQGRPRMDPLDQGRSAWHPEHAQPHAPRDAGPPPLGAAGRARRARARSGVIMASEASPLNLMAAPKGWGSPQYKDDGGSVITTNVDAVLNSLLNWGRHNSVWY